MFHLSAFVVLVVVASLEHSPVLAGPANDISCRIKCSNEPALAWATDGKNCMVFQNNCQLMSQNCQRADNSETVLTAVERDDCLTYCRRGCTREMNPVCTVNNGVSKTFNNPCLWSEEMCNSGEPFVFQFRGRCEPES